MDIDEIKARASALRHLQEAMRNAWPFLLPALKELKANRIENLLATGSDLTRGHVHGLQEIIELPETVRSEIEQLEQALNDLPE